MNSRIQKQEQPICSPKIILPNPNKKSDVIARSEEVQAIIDRMPTYWAKWVILCVGVLMGMIILLGFLIQYPDTVDGQISVTANAAPVRLVANSNGRITLFQPNKALLHKNDVISCIESGADYKHILWIDSFLKTLSDKSTIRVALPDTLLLGEVSSAYNFPFYNMSGYLLLTFIQPCDKNCNNKLFLTKQSLLILIMSCD